MRARLRAAHPPVMLRSLYSAPHRHDRWPDHVQRVAATVTVGQSLGPYASIADLSCGDAAIATRIGAPTLLLGDYAPGYPIHGPVEETIPDLPPVDLYVCCETLEHLDDPDGVLTAVRTKATTLLLSTPVDAWGDRNLEHYWAWSRADVEDMLVAAGWSPQVYEEVDFTAHGPDYYRFGIWGCR